MESSLMLFMYRYLQVCVRCSSPERRKNQAKWVSLCQLSIAEAARWVSLGRAAGGGLWGSCYCSAVWALHQMEQRQCPAVPPASLQQRTGMAGATAYPVPHHWGAGWFHHSLCLLLSASPLPFYLSLSILKKCHLKPFEVLKSLMFDIALDGNMPSTAVINEGCQLNL